jgi:hypothetical protein
MNKPVKNKLYLSDLSVTASRRSRPNPSIDRKSGGDRRKVDNPDFIDRGGIDRRSGIEARQKREKVAQNGKGAM